MIKYYIGGTFSNMERFTYKFTFMKTVTRNESTRLPSPISYLNNFSNFVSAAVVLMYLNCTSFSKHMTHLLTSCL